jgi:transcriptional regulator with XRE-family HTH domain
MKYAAQIRAARSLLGWKQDELASAAGVGIATLQRIEQTEGVVSGNFSTVLKIEKAFREAGIHFIDDDPKGMGVQLNRRTRE